MSETDNTPNPIVIPLNKGYSTVVDIADVDLARYIWRVSVNPSIPSCVYVKRTNKQLPKPDVYIHRVILERILGRLLERGEKVDHVDGNTLNNTRSNLRLASHSQNMKNQKKHIDNTSGYKGVSRDGKKWVAQIWLNGKSCRLGYFDTPEEAYASYCKAAREHYGEFARFI